jgi:transposase
LARLDERIEGLSDEIEALAHQDKGCERLMMVPGIGGCIRSRSAGWMRRCGSW